MSISAILVDDDPFVRLRWRRLGEGAGQIIRTVEAPSQFDRFRSRLSKGSTPIFVDAFLGGGISGLDFAETLHNEGFRRIYLATGLPASEFSGLPFLAGVIGKDPPHWLLDAPEPPSEGQLSATERRELLAAMTPAERSVFDRRMNKLYEARFGLGGDHVFGGDYPETVLEAWEAAIYLGVSDEELERRIRQAWLSA